MKDNLRQQLGKQFDGEPYYSKGAYSDFPKRSEINKQIAEELEKAYQPQFTKKPNVVVKPLQDENKRLKSEVEILRADVRRQNALLNCPGKLWKYIQEKMKHEIAAERARSIRRKSA